MVICLERRADAIATHYLASVKSRLVLTFWYRLTQVVLDKGPLNRCVYVCFVIMACIVLCLDLSIGWVSFWWGPLSGTTQVSQYQKGKTNHDFTGARDSELQWHQLGHMQVCTSLQTDNHASTSLYSVFYRPDALPAAQPTASKHWRGPTSWQTCYSCGGLLIICQIALKISDFDKFSS